MKIRPAQEMSTPERHFAFGTIAMLSLVAVTGLEPVTLRI
jgi:hypothetical protein